MNHYFAVSNNFFSTYSTIFLKLRYRDIVAFRTKNSMDLISRCDMEKYCLIIFNALVMQ